MNASPLTGRIAAAPSDLLNEEVLRPQFDFDAAWLLPWYVRAEKVLLTEYVRMGLLSMSQAQAIEALLDTVDPSALAADPRFNMSDLAFALERFVLERLPEPVPRWHVDRSRNDLQACAHLLFCRERLRATAHTLLACFEAGHQLASRHADTPMPGYTHLQPAQVMTPGFYMAGLTGQLLHSLRRLSSVYEGTEGNPLGAGAMAGQELDWDRERIASLLGFTAAHPHPLTAVASRSWALEAAAEASHLGVALSRFVTDLMAWTSGAYQFAELPDELAGISSAMPQKKNYPVLERIRGRTAHLTAAYLGIATTQRATAFSNSVEVAKEGGTQLHGLFDTLQSTLRLLTSVLEHLRFSPDRMRAACESEYLGGFSLANELTLRADVPWRTAQVIAGRYIVHALERGLAPDRPCSALLADVAEGQGVRLSDPGSLLERGLGPERGLYGKQRSGSTHPAAVRALLERQSSDAAVLAADWRAREERTERAAASVDRELGLRAHRESSGTGAV
ncbi:lyase family protein [Nocardiopsis sp. NPDC049922]|uniref:argininosuccinate lyase n=1 Tax=Nocardiopsis sp. NPDC049922 TaxID=3155157 RepID=UPI0033D37722